MLEDDTDFKYVREKLLDGILKVVYGGKLRTEYVRSKKIKRVLRKFDQIGIAQAYDDEQVNSEARRIRKLPACQSDDAHIIALAKLSGARLLCSEDGELHQDFRNSRLLSNPRGKVYQTSNHRPLLDQYCRLCKR
ncbi:MAG: hypothetical protein FVQ85_04315 [Planctomycetes bacterium]|nr:hypothetical protein [Planctomycetota bacterium]